jgi:hypothetical protein
MPEQKSMANLSKTIEFKSTGLVRFYVISAIPAHHTHLP